MQTIRSVHDLIKELKKNPPKLILCKVLYEWLLQSDWHCLLSDELKNYINNGGIVIKNEDLQ